MGRDETSRVEITSRTTQVDVGGKSLMDNPHACCFCFYFRTRFRGNGLIDRDEKNKTDELMGKF